MTAAIMNTHVRDNLKAIGDAWTAYTPTWSVISGTAPVIGNGTITGKWLDRGKTVDFRIKITMGSTTTYGNNAYTFSLPTAALGVASNDGMNINGGVVDTGVAYHPLLGRASSTTLFILDVAATGVPVTGPSSPFAFGNGDVITAAGSYERA